MIIDPLAAQRFMAGYKAILLHVHAIAKLETSEDIVPNLVAAREFLTEHPQQLNLAFAALEADKRGIDEDIANAIRSIRVDQWVYLRHTTRHAIFLDSKVTIARAVRALTQPIAEITGKPAVTFKAGMFELAGCYVCDGLIQTPVYLGPGYRASYNDAYAQLRKAGQFLIKPAS